MLKLLKSTVAGSDLTTPSSQSMSQHRFLAAVAVGLFVTQLASLMLAPSLVARSTDTKSE